MGNRERKKAFPLLYQPPAPQRRGPFLARLEPSGLSTGEFLCSQLFYLRPWNWLLGVAIFAAALFLMETQVPEQIRLVSALLPFAALCWCCYRGYAEYLRAVTGVPQSDFD